MPPSMSCNQSSESQRWETNRKCACQASEGLSPLMSALHLREQTLDHRQDEGQKPACPDSDWDSRISLKLVQVNGDSWLPMKAKPNENLQRGKLASNRLPGFSVNISRIWVYCQSCSIHTRKWDTMWERQHERSTRSEHTEVLQAMGDTSKSPTKGQRSGWPRTSQKPHRKPPGPWMSTSKVLSEPDVCTHKNSLLGMRME